MALISMRQLLDHAAEKITGRLRRAEQGPRWGCDPKAGWGHAIGPRNEGNVPGLIIQ